MTHAPAKSEPRMWWVAGVCAVAGFALFQFFGNATRGYVDTLSMFWWWGSQWIDPQAETQHGWLILGISGWLLWRNLREGGGAKGRAPARSLKLGPPFAALVVGLGLHAAGFVAQQTRISIVAFLIFAWGVLRLGGGTRWGDAAKFPLGFLVFAIPLNVLDSVGFWLRLWVIDAAEAIAHVTHLDVWRSGTQLLAADGRYQYDVAAACSGVRSLMALSALSLLVGYLNFQSTWRRALIFALCFPLTYLGNVARIAAIVFAAQLGGQAWGERAHDAMGFGVFVIVLGGVLAAAKALDSFVPEKRDDGQCNTLCYTAAAGGGGFWRWGGAWLKKTPAGEFHVIRETMIGGVEVESPAPHGAGDARVRGAGAFRAVTGAATIAVFSVAEMFWLGQLSERPGDGAAGVRLAADGVNPVELPAFVGTEWIGRRAEVTAVEREILPADTGFSRRSYVQVQGGGHTVLVSIVLSGRDRTSIHRPELCLVGQGWTIAASDGRRLELGNAFTVPATLLRTERVDPRTGKRIPAVVAYWFVNGDTAVATHWERFGRDAWNRLVHGRADRWAYVLVQADALDGEAAGLARIREVLATVGPSFQRVR